MGLRQRKLKIVFWNKIRVPTLFILIYVVLDIFIRGNRQERETKATRAIILV